MLWNFLYWLLLVIAAVLLLRGLFWDRAGFRGRAKRRCRRCWYDLTGMDVDVTEGPVVCPECGKAHKTKRSMRRTRRGKRWIAAVVAVWLMAYAASVTPKVQKNGWGAAVPRVVLVASLPFLSEEQGAGIYSTVGFGNGGVAPSRWDSFMMKQAGGGFGTWATPGNDPQFGWLSRRLAVILARFESESVITDATTVKGSVYRSIFTQIEHAGAFYPFESRWAHSINYAEIDIQDAVAPDAVVYGDIRIRRLIKGSYGLRVGWRGDVFRCDTSSSMWVNGMHPTFSTQRENDEYWIQRFLWDGKTRVDAAGKSMHWLPDQRIALGVSSPAGSGSVASDISVRYTIFEAEHKGDRVVFGDQVAESDTTVSISVDQDAAIIEDSSAELEQFILDHMKAELTVQYDPQREKWVPVVKLRASTSDFVVRQKPELTLEQMKALEDGGQIPDILFERRYEIPDLLDGGILFGGRVSLEIVWDLGDGNPYAPTLMWGRETMWRWGTVENPESMGMPPARENRDPELVLLSRSMNKEMIPGELPPKGNTPARYRNHSYTLRVRLQPSPNSTWKDYGGFWGRRVFVGDLYFPISGWTTEELRALVINGTIPEHAMP